jgi:hypothetical protein
LLAAVVPEQAISDGNRILVDYFHDFYMHGFSMAKRWGSELPNMRQDQVLAATSQVIGTPNAWTPSIFLDLSPNSPSLNSLRGSHVSSPPTRLCRWSIHAKSVHYTTEVLDPLDDSNDYTEDDPELSISPFTAALQRSLASSDFTSTPKSDLPIAQEIVSQSLEANPNALKLDAWKFAIMAGNDELLDQMLDYDYKPPDDIESIHPFHLAASYLDGGETCCAVFTSLIGLLGSDFIFHHNTDHLGHTILDALLVSTIRSHTSHRYPGEEKDICGRWIQNPQTSANYSTKGVREFLHHGNIRSAILPCKQSATA